MRTGTFPLGKLDNFVRWGQNSQIWLPKKIDGYCNARQKSMVMINEYVLKENVEIKLSRILTYTRCQFVYGGQYVAELCSIECLLFREVDRF